MSNRRLVLVACLALGAPLGLAACGADCVDGSKMDCTLGTGAAGQMICRDGTFGSCEPLGDTCSEGAKRDCSTACGTGKETCRSGEWVDCDAPTPSAETCDGLDNNCNGQIDETCDCEDGETEPCFDGQASNRNVGICRDGQRTCNRGSWGACTGAVYPTTEACDGVDNDCNGVVDNGCSCTNGNVEACYDGPVATRNVGACRDGEHVCNNGAWGSCLGAIKPVAETCNGIDDDCNGTVDDGCQCQNGRTQACTTACGAGTEICVNGEWKNCTAPQPQQEVCNGLDDNCNGQIDETCICVVGRTESCWEYAAALRNVGICHDGTKTCTVTNGVANWGPCQNQVPPAASESCNNTLDDNCNGTVNETCTCSPNTHESCGTDVGACVAGTHYCENNAWGPCLGETAPATETCDGIDNNCDGTIDDGLQADSAEQNNTCDQATTETIQDSSSAPLVIGTNTIYPSGDVDYYQVVAEDGTNVMDTAYCWFLNRKPTCQFLDITLTSPSGLPAQYVATLMAETCDSPAFADTDNGDKTASAIWHGRCTDNDSANFWVKVEPKAGTNPTYSCEPYTLSIAHSSQNIDCCTLIACSTDADCWGENWGCGGCDTSSGTCRQRCEVTSCTGDADCTAVGCGTCSGGSCTAN